MKLLRWVPNLLTIIRMMFAVPLAYVIWTHQVGWSLGLLTVAGITDLADGFLARHFNARTVLGSWLDPAADKILITTVLITLTVLGVIPNWFCVITVGRDLGLAVGSVSLKLRGYDVKIRPYLSGKLATVGQNVTLLLAIMQPIWSSPGMLSVFLLGSAALTVVSAVLYARGCRALLTRTAAFG